MQKNKTYLNRIVLFIVALFTVFNIGVTYAANKTVNFDITYKIVNFAEKPVKALSINNQIPGPTLQFKEGDHVTINVHNHLDKETAIHWHGLILPWQMDGVSGITQHAIPPGEVFHYQFTLRQSGTYWYHAHAGLQEQQGLYGAFIIKPLKQPNYKYNKDYAIVLSDWNNTSPENVLANLKKDGDYYSAKFPLQPSLMKFIHDYQNASIAERKNLIGDYKMMQQMRMSIYDFSDVAYDAFLLNGQPNSHPWTAQVKKGDVVRLRFIGAGGSTIFHVKIPNASMKIIQVDGNDVVPYTVNDFTIAPGETFDVLVKIQNNSPYIIYAESNDTLGAAYGALITSPNQLVNYQQIPKFPEPLPVTRDMMSMMMAKTHQNSIKINNMPQSMQHMTMASMPHSMSMNNNMKMDHAMPMDHSQAMDMPTEPTIIGDSLSSQLPDSWNTTAGTKYENLEAIVKTNDPNKPVDKIIKMELFGYMDRYIWFINGVPEHEAAPIILEPNKRYRIVFTNTSMMHHPMHIHGHWFILRKGKGAYDPLLHTIDIAPGATVTADLDAEASGQWLFHCHMLYHMMSGMARVFQYSTLIDITQNVIRPQHIIKKAAYHNRPIVKIDEVRSLETSLIKHHMAHERSFYFANFIDIGADPFRNIQKLNFKGLYGPDYNKIGLLIEDSEIKKGTLENADVDIFYWHLLDQFWAIKAGINYYYRPAKTPYLQPSIGIEGLMPYFVDTDIRSYFHNGSLKFDVALSRDSQITNNFLIRAGIRGIIATKTVVRDEVGNGLNQMRYILRPYYRVMPGLNIFAEYEHQQSYGSYKTIQVNNGGSRTENSLSFGIAAVF